jgi:hypothetical protein
VRFRLEAHEIPCDLEPKLRGPHFRDGITIAGAATPQAAVCHDGVCYDLH